MKKYSTFIKTIRECQRISQSDLAKRVGISRVSLNKYEDGKSTLSKQTMHKIAGELQLNPQYIEGVESNPFKSENIIKLVLPEHFKLTVDFSLIELIIEYNNNLDLIFMTPQHIIAKIFRKTAFEHPIYAITIRDSDNNIILFRRKTKSVLNAAIVGERGLELYISSINKQREKKINYSTISINEDLYERIYNWSVERADVELLFDQFSVKEDVHLSEKEKEIIQMIRDNKIDLDIAKKALSNLIK